MIENKGLEMQNSDLCRYLFYGIIEYTNDNLVVLSASAINIKNVSEEFLNNLKKDTQEKLMNKDITDHDRYVLNHKLDVVKEIRI